MELISQTDSLRTRFSPVHEYTQLAVPAVGNLFRKPLYLAGMVQQAELGARRDAVCRPGDDRGSWSDVGTHSGH